MKKTLITTSIVATLSIFGIGVVKYTKDKKVETVEVSKTDSLYVDSVKIDSAIVMDTLDTLK